MPQTDDSLGSMLPIGRRAFIRGGALLLAGGALPERSWSVDDQLAMPAARMGLLTDVHYADIATQGQRHYRDSLNKMRAAVARFNEEKLPACIHLGDLIDAAKDVTGELGHLKTIDAEFAKFKGDRHYVLGNHCIWTLTKQEFADTTGAPAKHYSFDHGGFHFVLLDACYRKDGKPYARKNFQWTDTDIPKEQQEWLQADLAKTDKKTLVFVHQRLDAKGESAIHSAADVRKLLEESGKVLAVFMGHTHQNAYQELNGIHYCVLRAMIEGPGEKNNSYSILELHADNTLRVDGFVQQRDYAWAAKKAAKSA